jgi:hypothetical protein
VSCRRWGKRACFHQIQTQLKYDSAGFPQCDESDCRYGSHKAITKHLGRVATLLTSFRGQPPSPCGSTGCAWIYKSGVAGILSTFSLLTFAIETPAELFKTVAFLNCGRSLPVVAHAKSGWSNITQDTEYLDSHQWTNEVRCVYKNVGYTLRSHEYDGTQLRRFNACHAERQMVLFCLQAPVHQR